MLYIICGLIILITVYYLFCISKLHGISKKLIYFQIMFNCFIKFLQGYINVPSITNYITDLITVIIIFIYCLDKKRKKIPVQIIIVFFIYFFITVMSFIANKYNIILYLWGFRNNMRFILFSMMCTVYFEIEDLKNVFKIILSYFILNIIAVTYEFFFAGLTFRTGDLISGLYSLKNVIGGNGDLNWILCIVLTYAIIQYLNKEKSLYFMLFCLVSAVYMAALSELKVFFVEIIFIALICIALCKKSVKLVMFFSLGILVFVLGVNMLYLYFPQFNDFFAIENLKSAFFSNESYNNQNGMSRSGAVLYVWENFLQSFADRVIGIGFGNADFSGFSFLTSDFYIKNKNTSYQWFYAPFILVETGILGLLAYINIILNFLKKNINMYMRRYNDNRNYNILSIVICFLAFVMLFYNITMKTETSGYLIYLLLSMPYIIDNKEKVENENNN